MESSLFYHLFYANALQNHISVRTVILDRAELLPCLILDHAFSSFFSFCVLQNSAAILSGSPALPPRKS